MRTIREWQALLGLWNREYKTKKERTPAFMFAHAHEEVSEAWKAWREGDLTRTIKEVKKHGVKMFKPEGLGSELADAVGTCIILAEEFDIDLEQELELKWVYLKARLAAKNAKGSK